MNIYSVLDLSDNEEEKPKVAAKGKDAAAAKPAPAAAKKDAAAKPVKAADTKAKETAAPAGAKPKAATDKPKATPAADAAEGDAAKDDNRGGRARGKEYRERGGRGGRGGEATAEGERRPKRDFERRSGTGRGREVSKGGRGAFGFGNPAQDAQDAEKDPNAVEAILEPVDGAEEPAAPQYVPEPEPVTFTLDEFLQKRDEARKALATETKLRTVDQSALAGLSRKEDEAETVYGNAAKAAKADSGRKDQRSTGKTQVLDVAFKFAAIQVDEERGGRGGRGGEGRGRGGDGRGRGGRGEGRGRGEAGRGAPRPASGGKAAAFNNTDFPSL